VLQAGAQRFISGNVSLSPGGSEAVFKCWIDNALTKGAGMTPSLKGCESSVGYPQNHHGISGNGNDDVLPPPGTSPSTCGPASCAGCCSADDVCRAGNELAACGTGGLACKACGAQQTCSDGTCRNAPPPKVNITYPPAAARLPTSFTLTAQIQDASGVVKVELAVDSQVITTANSAVQSFPLVLNPGAHTLRLSAWNAAGTQGQTMVSITVEGTPDPGPNPTPGPGPSPGPSPDGKGGLGASCQFGADCTSGLCVNDMAQNLNYCSQTCSATNPCPVGSCLTATDNHTQVCAISGASGGNGGNGAAPGDRAGLLGGCSVAGGGRPLAAPWLLLAGLALVRRRRRRSPSSRTPYIG